MSHNPFYVVIIFFFFFFNDFWISAIYVTWEGWFYTSVSLVVVIRGRIVSGVAIRGIMSWLLSSIYCVVSKLLTLTQLTFYKVIFTDYKIVVRA